jgi:hypothetical protein
MRRQATERVDMIKRADQVRADHHEQAGIGKLDSSGIETELGVLHQPQAARSWWRRARSASSSPPSIAAIKRGLQPDAPRW